MINESIYKILYDLDNSIEKIERSGLYTFYYEDIKYKELIDTKILILMEEDELKDSLCKDKEIELYNCIDDKCTNVKGYVRCGIDSIIHCDDKCRFSEKTDINCEEFINLGTAYIDSSSNFQLCVNIGIKNNIYREKEIISGEKNYIFSFNKESNSYNLFISSEKGNIISSSFQNRGIIKFMICLKF